MLLPGGTDQVLHLHAAAVLGTKKGGRQSDVLDIAARKLKAAGHELEVQVFSRRRLWPDLLPDGKSLIESGKGKLDRELDAPNESIIHILAKIGGQNHSSLGTAPIFCRR